jgi:hypothetical protein
MPVRPVLERDIAPLEIDVQGGYDHQRVRRLHTERERMRRVAFEIGEKGGKQ